VEGRHENAQWTKTARLVTGQNQPDTPIELVPEHLPRISENGIDGVWSMGGGEFHFVEAKFSESAGAMFGRGAQEWAQPGSAGAQGAAAPTGTRRTSATGNTRAASPSRSEKKLAPPPDLTERQVALWCMLGQRAKGLQMGIRWTRNSCRPEMFIGNQANRFLYVFFAVPSTSPPKNYVPAPGLPLKKGVAPGVVEHITVCAQVAERLITGGDVYDLNLHAEHQPTHGISDEFSAAELDEVTRIYDTEKLRPRAAPPPGGPGSPPPPPPPSTPRSTRGR
jgi:hypothetical protein